MSKLTSEPLLSMGKIRITKSQESKVKAFCDVIVPTGCFGNMTIRNFKVIDGGNGLFVSLPNRSATVKGGNVVNPDTGEVIRVEEDKTSYYNDLRFDNVENYNKFKEELDKTVLTAVRSRLSSAE